MADDEPKGGRDVQFGQSRLRTSRAKEDFHSIRAERFEECEEPAAPGAGRERQAWSVPMERRAIRREAGTDGRRFWAAPTLQLIS